jgi:predicted DNA binding CopG/RHH family protein
MNAQSSQHEQRDIEDIAERAERGEDISAHFTTTYTAKQRVNIDFPLALLRTIDAECQRIGITRQAWIKMVCAERLHSHGPHHCGHLAIESDPLKGRSTT